MSKYHSLQLKKRKHNLKIISDRKIYELLHELNCTKSTFGEHAVEVSDIPVRDDPSVQGYEPQLIRGDMPLLTNPEDGKSCIITL